MEAKQHLRIVAEASIPFLDGLLLPDVELIRIHSADFSPETIAGADALVVRSITKCGEPLLEGSGVRCIATATAGMDHIDMAYCADHDIAVYNAAGCNAVAVAQYVLCSLSLLSQERGVALAGKRLGIVGVGHVGRELLRLAPALGLIPLCYDPPRAEMEGMEGFVTLEELQQHSDIISLHVPLVRQGLHRTEALVDYSFLARCAKSPILINACRGPVVVGEDALRALREGWVSSLILDCWEGEPRISGSLLAHADIATPHIAGFSADGKLRGSRMALVAVLEHWGRDARGLLEEDVLPMPEHPDISLNDFEGEQALAHALLHTLDLSEVNRALHRDPEHFDAIRKAYVYPREMSAYTVSVGDRIETVALSGLDFGLC